MGLRGNYLMAWTRNIPVASNWCMTDLDNWQPFYNLLNDVSAVITTYASSCSFYASGLAQMTPSAFRCISGPYTAIGIPEQLVQRCLDIMEYMVDKTLVATDQALDFDRMENFHFRFTPSAFFDLAALELPPGTSSTLLDAIESDYSGGSDWRLAMQGCIGSFIPNTIYAMCEAIRKNFAVLWSHGSYNESASGQPAVIRDDMTSAAVPRLKDALGALTGSCATALSSGSSNWDSASWGSHFSPSIDVSRCYVLYTENSVPRYSFSANWEIEKFELTGLNFPSAATFESFEYRRVDASPNVFFDPVDGAAQYTVQNIRTETVSAGNWTSQYVLDGETGDLSPYDQNPPVNCGGIGASNYAWCFGGINLVMELVFDEP